MGSGLEIFLKDACILKMKATQESFAQPQMKIIKNVTSSTWGGVWKCTEANTSRVGGNVLAVGAEV